jgi:hypothetical protein
LLSPTSLLAAYATAPFPPVPAELWPRLRAASLAASFGPARAAILARAVRLDPDTGFPRPLDGRRPVPRAAALAVTALVTMVAAGASTFLAPDRPTTAPPPADQAAPPGSVAPGSPSPPPAPDPVVPVPASGGVPAGQVEPPTSPPPAPGPDAELSSSPPGPAGTLTVEATAEPVCAEDGSYQLSATLTASRPLAAATLSVTAQGETANYPMTVDGSTASAHTDRMTANNLRWQVDVADPGQDSAATSQVKINRVCKD